jgi:hypothetical protein
VTAEELGEGAWAERQLQPSQKRPHQLGAHLAAS